MRKHSRIGAYPCFVIREAESRAEDAARVVISHEIIERMIKESEFRLSRVTTILSNKLAKIEIFFCMNQENSYPISGFPRSLLRNEANYQSSLTPCSFQPSAMLISHISHPPRHDYKPHALGRPRRKSKKALEGSGCMLQYGLCMEILRQGAPAWECFGG